jgi:hypothetical protein
MQSTSGCSFRRCKGAASDIMTLAGDAANSLQAAQVFYTAAWALIGLQRFELLSLANSVCFELRPDFRGGNNAIVSTCNQAKSGV